MSRFVRNILIVLAAITAITGCSLTASRESAPASTPTPPLISSTLANTPIPIIQSSPSPIIVTATLQPTATRAAANTVFLPPTITSTPVYAVYQPVYSSGTPLCAAMPAGNYSVNIRSGPSTSYPVVASLPVNNWISASQAVSGWYQVSFPGTPANGGWVSASYVTLQQPCACGPACAGIQQPTAVGVCTITVGSAGATAFTKPSASAPQFGFLPPGTTMQPSARTADNWYGFDPGIAQAGVTGLDRLRWVLADSYISLTGDCASVPPVPILWLTPVPTECIIVPGTVVTTYYQPSTSAQVFYTGAVDHAEIVGQVGGWYAFDPAVAQAPNVGLYRMRWVQSVTVGLTGNCGSIPTLQVDPPALPAGSNCLISPSTSSPVNIYPEATFDIGTDVKLIERTSVQAVGLTADGWYAVALNTGIVPTDIGIYALRWIYSGDSISLSGTGCDTLPAIVE